MNHSLVFVLGPPRVGKSTVGKLLTEKLGIPFEELSLFNQEALAGSGFEQKVMEQTWTTSGFEGLIRYVQSFQPYVLRAFLAKHTNGVVELDSSMMAAVDPQIRSDIAEILNPYPRILLLPEPDAEASLQTLLDRQRIMYNGMELNEYFVRHPSNQALAKQRVYTRGQSPAETTDAVLAAIDQSQQRVILIGPMGTGKSTIAERLSERLGWPRESMDHHRWRYYEEAGFSRDEMTRLDNELGPQGVLDYWKRFDVAAVDRLLEEFPTGVIDFGAGHSVYEDSADFEHVRRSLEPIANVVLLLPSPDPDEALHILEQRNTRTIDGVELTRYLLTDPSSQDLATEVVYTAGKTPNQVRDEILEQLQRT